jgi:hypothetical protein
LAALAAGGRLLLGYQSDPGAAAAAAPAWPEGCPIRPEAGRATVLLFAHPRCPCTRASLDELAWLLARSEGRADAWAVFVVPAGAPPGWERGSAWGAAEAVPRLRTWADLGGAEARRFGAATSGQVMVYGEDGRLAFSGGVTAGRGHRGGNPGRDAALAAIRGRAQRGARPVFGCPLFGAESACAGEGSECSR